MQSSGNFLLQYNLKVKQGNEDGVVKKCVLVLEARPYIFPKGHVMV